MMEIRDFYARLLELVPPWTVKSIVWEDNPERMDVFLECEETALFPCPECGRPSPVCDRSPLKTWRHLDTCGKTTHLLAGLPIVDCTEHGRRHPAPPWGETDSPATFAFERLVARLAQEFGDTGKTARFFGVERVQVRRILRRPAEAEEATGTEEAGRLTADDDQITPPTPPAPQARQIGLFERNDMIFVNQGIRAFRDLELEKAVELFQKHRQVHPKGYDISSRLAAAELLLEGIRKAPDQLHERPAYLCRLWDAFEDFVESEGTGRLPFIAEVKRVFFSRAIEEIQRCCRPAADASTLPTDVSSATADRASRETELPSADTERPSRADDPSKLSAPPESPAADTSPLLPGSIPLGYLLLQAGRYDQAIRSLQDSIPKMPHNAALYGYLGDAYGLRGNWKTARQCYREACLIDPAGIDWRHLQDEDLKKLKRELSLDYGSDKELALAWLPSHARVEGLFERKTVGLNDGLKEMVEVYLALEKAWTKRRSPRLAPKLFFRGMILCENEESLKFITKIDPIQVRRRMKEANPDLFEDFMATIVERKG